MVVEAYSLTSSPADRSMQPEHAVYVTWDSARTLREGLQRRYTQRGSSEAPATRTTLFVKNIEAGGTYLLLLSPFPKSSAGLRPTRPPVRTFVRSSVRYSRAWYRRYVTEKEGSNVLVLLS
jgi:hypothetical protein